MRPNVPTVISDEVHSLEPEALVSLYKLTLAGGLTIFRLSPQGQKTWQGNTYDDIPCVLTEANISADGKVDRPTFTFANPGGIFTQYATSGLENAILRRYQLRKYDLDNNLNYALEESLKITQVMTINKKLITAQLRDVFDGPSYVLPFRSYIPPEFPFVKL